MITQNQENSISLSEEKKAEQTRIKERQIQAEQEQKAASIRNQTANAFGTMAGNGSSQGASLAGTGDQGVPIGGSGFGQFSLNGRSVKGGLPRPAYSIQEEGIVVIQIIVNPKGIVTASSVALKGTNTDNSTLRSAALSAAKQARFNVIEGNQVQSGTITYRFRLK
jgi:TonB family protein